MLFTRPRHIYHLAQASLWAGNEHAYLPPTHDADGFIHCAAIANSLVDIANCFYTSIDGDFVCECMTDREVLSLSHSLAV